MARRTAAQRRIALTTASDQMLLELTRDGMSEAFGELWSRHSGAVTAGARLYTGYDPNDLMQEAFLKVYASIQDGGPLPVSFRAYVATTARRLAIDKSRQDRGAFHEPIDDALDHPALSDEDFSHRMLEDSTTAHAFRELPSRYREALWYRDVEDLPVQEIARYVGMSANATSVLIKRARDAFKTSWIKVQLSPQRDLPQECSDIVPKLAAYSSDKLSVKERDRVDLHLFGCTHCGALASEADSLHKKLALVLLPLLLLGGSPGYLAWVQSRENRTPIPTAANYVNVQLDGVRTAPIAVGTALLASAATTSASRTRAKPIAVVVTALLIAGIGVAGAAGYPWGALEEGQQMPADEEPIARVPTESSVPSGKQAEAARDGDPHIDTLLSTEGTTTVLLDGAGSGSRVLVPPSAPDPGVEPDPEAEPEPVTYPEPRVISTVVVPSAEGKPLYISGTPGATFHVAVTHNIDRVQGSVTQQFTLVDDGAGEVRFTFPGYSGMIVTVVISQEYDTAEGRVLDPQTVTLPNFLVFGVRP